MKKKFLLPVLICAVIMTACSSNDTGMAGLAAPSKGVTNGFAAESYSGSSSASYDNAGDYGLYEDYDDYTEADAASEGGTAGLAAEDLQREMLVYSCSMNIDTLEFDASINSFKNTLNMYGGFIEQENYSDGGSNSGWYNEKGQKWKSYTATVRVPSRNYDDFCNSAAEMGDLRSKNARVENVSREYSDLKTTLEIYEAKEERYITLLAGITDDEYAVAIERELTDLQIDIAKIRTRMNEIQTDVAYSYVYITFNEVKEYVSEPVKTDTFFDRLLATLQDAGSGFLEFLEGLLFLIIYAAPYLLLIGIIVFVIVSIIKAAAKRKAEKWEEKMRAKQAFEQDLEQPSERVPEQASEQAPQAAEQASEKAQEVPEQAPEASGNKNRNRNRNKK